MERMCNTANEKTYTQLKEFSKRNYQNNQIKLFISTRETSAMPLCRVRDRSGGTEPREWIRRNKLRILSSRGASQNFDCHREQGAPGVYSYYGNPTASLSETARTRLPFPSRCTVALFPMLPRVWSTPGFLHSQRSRIVQRDDLYLSPFALSHLPPPPSPSWSSLFLTLLRLPTLERGGGRLVLEIKGLARQENLNQETHRATSWILENWKSVNPQHPSTMNSRLVRAPGAYRNRLSQPETMQRARHEINP